MIRDVQPQLDFDSVASRHLSTGTGQLNVIMLHGLFGKPRDWWPIMEALSDHYRFFALQLPIDRESDRQYRSFRSLSQLTDFVAKFIDDKQLDNVVLVGNSLGGQLALDYYLRCPDRVHKIVLAGSAGLYEKSLSGGPLRLSRGLVRKQACEIFYDSAVVTEELVDDIYTMLCDRNYRRFLLRVAKATRDRYMLDELGNVSVPTKVIWGRNDSITPPFVAEQFCEAIPCSELTFIEQCGHSPPIERPQDFARELHAFLIASSPDHHHVIRKPR